MRPTRLGKQGLGFYAAIGVAFFASAYSNLFFLLLAFLTLMALMNVAWTLRNMRGVTGEILEVEPSPAGAGQPIRAHLKAPGRARYQVACELELDGHDPVSIQADALVTETVVDGRLPPMRRGLYHIRRACLVSSYPLGLLRSAREIPAPQELIVYPEPTELPEARSGSEALAELCGHHGAPDGRLQPSGLREYRTGDELRAVHWKASARRTSLVIKEWEGGSGQSLEVLLDRRCEPDALEEALALLSALIHVARDNKELVTIHSQDLVATYGKGHRPWRNALRFLARATTLPADGAAPPRVSPGVARLPLVASYGGAGDGR